MKAPTRPSCLDMLLDDVTRGHTRAQAPVGARFQASATFSTLLRAGKGVDELKGYIGQHVPALQAPCSMGAQLTFSLLHPHRQMAQMIRPR